MKRRIFPQELINELHFYLGLQSKCPLAAACVPKLRKALPNSHTTETLTCLSYAKILRRSVAFQLAQTELVKKWRTHRIFMCGEKSLFRSMNVSLTLVFFGAICSNLRPPAPRKFPIFFQKVCFSWWCKTPKKTTKQWLPEEEILCLLHLEITLWSPWYIHNFA